MSGGDFDIGATLRNRLQEITQKKESIAVSKVDLKPLAGSLYE